MLNNGGQMNERIEKIESLLVRLTERTDAIAQSMELMAGMQRTTEKELQQLGGFVRELVGSVNNIGTATQDLIVLMHDHEQRITALEG